MSEQLLMFFVFVRTYHQKWTANRLSDPVRVDVLMRLIDMPCQRLADFNSCSMRSAKNIFISDWYGTSRLLANTLSSSSINSGKRKEIFLREGGLVKGDSFWVEYRGEKLPLDFIFGTPIKREIHGFPVYTTGSIYRVDCIMFVSNNTFKTIRLCDIINYYNDFCHIQRSLYRKYLGRYFNA